ncbi:tetratricopeptide repeat protein [Caulobacter vibrioides]|uniref:Tetratricopeptide repeat protein n=1 Tax=Caulobacter vibrioides (strain NA1000 / CB15N) TaxID=565050 RepID=A0A0H3C4J4_CAUVN|nr:tetratricopeptide repeat protein [Caulobacter vibrioides]YP_002515790.2 TPR repeat family protein [Caulobacter vibrioides NA1000]ACL93882.2 TPR repeat family protein [Caulobacter vibrioides NA1000]QXZ53908.1 tetratricopeptide repeat protein [Caulobacter vibrioides]
MGDAMLARLVGIILGLILASSGYVVAGWGSLGTWATTLDLGPFEPHRPAVGVAAAIVGGVLIVAALLPRPKRKPRKTAPATLGLELPDEAAPSASLVAAAAAPAAPVATPVSHTAPAAPAAAPVAPPRTFAEMRARLITLSREDSWGECARLLAAMKRAAHTDEELAIVHRDLGDFARAQGQLDEAGEAYETAVAYARQVRQTRPTDASTDLLAGALSGVGDVAEAEGRLDAALSAFEEALALRRSRGAREANDPNAQRALSVNLERLADLREDRGHRMRALDLYRESYDIAGRLAAADPARFGPDLAATRARLSELEARIST